MSTVVAKVGEFAHLTTDTGSVAQWLKTDGWITAISSKAAAYTVTNQDHSILIDTSGDNVTVTLPASPTTGEIHFFKCTDATNTATVARNGKNIDGAASDFTLVLNECVAVQYDGTGWQKISEYVA